MAGSGLIVLIYSQKAIIIIILASILWLKGLELSRLSRLLIIFEPIRVSPSWLSEWSPSTWSNIFSFINQRIVSRLHWCMSVTGLRVIVIKLVCILLMMLIVVVLLFIMSIHLLLLVLLYLHML